MRVLVQLRVHAELREAVAAGEGMGLLTSQPRPLVSGLDLDAAFEPVEVPSPVAPSPGANRFALSQPLEFSMEPGRGTVVVRGDLSDALISSGTSALTDQHPDVVGVFADPTIQHCPTCGDTPPQGDAAQVAELLTVSKLKAAGLTGQGVYLAVVDTGINRAFFAGRGFPVPNIDVEKSWTPPSVSTTPGEHPVAHATMCAFDAMIAAPEATILDCAVLATQRQGATEMSGVLSDALLAYSHLLSVLNALAPSERAMVVTNSWGMFSPEMDFPVGSPGNYSDNPAHPFNLIVSSLEGAGADILFAAGNCGRQCPDIRCAFGDLRPICGANSHPRVLCIGGVDVHQERVGYSSQGPGRLIAQKPDICAYTHFAGSGAEGPADTGTSAACPTAAGVVAAVRTSHRRGGLSPQALRSLAEKTAIDRGQPGFDYDYGWGIIDPAALTTVFEADGAADAAS
jgi:Subtilase family